MSNTNPTKAPDTVTRGGESDMNQIADYPKGARVEAIQDIPMSSPSQNFYADPLPRGTRGIVVSHTDDGRAYVNFEGHKQEGYGHTFDEPEKYIRVVVVDESPYCSECFGYTHVPWCSRCVAESKNENEQGRQEPVVVTISAVRAAIADVIDAGDEGYHQLPWLFHYDETPNQTAERMRFLDAVERRLRKRRATESKQSD